MSGRRQYSEKHLLPDNPMWVEFVRSDGDQSTWPTKTTREVDNEGHVNFMKPVPLDEPGVSVKWRVEVGGALAVLMKWQEGPTYVLKEWPQGYAMFDHHKGPADAPRHDVYLFGCLKARYRSVPEFIPHAFWLMVDPTLDRGNCKCKYCSKKSQREITSTMTFLPQARHMDSSATSRPHKRGFSSSKAKGKTREQQRVPHRPYAAVQRMPKPIRPLPTGPQIPVIRERNNDLRAAYSKSSMRLKRWFREGEVLWCHLDPPIRAENGGDVCIRFWPGLVQEVKLKSSAVPRENGSAVGGDGVKRREGEDGEDDEPLPWTIRQSTMYKMKLLAVSHSYTIPDEKVLPYQAYAPPTELIQTIRELAWGNLNISPDSLAVFNPCPPMSSDVDAATGSSKDQNGARFSDAVGPYSFAVQIAAKLAEYWSLTNEWDFKYTTSSNEDSTIISNVVSTPSIANPAAPQNSSGTASFGNRGISGVSGPMTEVDVQNLGARMLGIPALPAQTLTQTRYQGLWWGAERIWIDELVRLKMARRQIAPEGGPDIYPPAGPSQKTLEYNTNSLPVGDITQAELGAGGRGLFLRLEGLFVVDTPREDGAGMRKECRASGMLYELADEDWADPYEEIHKAFAIEKEKERLAELSALTSAADWGALIGNSADTSSSSPTPGSGLSHPISASPYPLPKPPTGYKFRPILAPGHETVISLTLISGRYYPSILVHPLLQPTVREAYANPLENGGLHQGSHLWALEGLASGNFNAVDPTKAKTNRVVMLRDADNEARVEVEEACAGGNEMKVDGEDVEMQKEMEEMEVDM